MFNREALSDVVAKAVVFVILSVPLICEATKVGI
jgi:hypothetical protein